MYGDQPTGTIEGAVISALAHEGLTVIVNGKAAMLAIVTADGEVYAKGDAVTREFEAVAINAYCKILQGQGHMRTLGNPVPRDRPT